MDTWDCTFRFGWTGITSLSRIEIPLLHSGLSILCLASTTEAPKKPKRKQKEDTTAQPPNFTTFHLSPAVGRSGHDCSYLYR